MAQEAKKEGMDEECLGKPSPCAPSAATVMPHRRALPLPRRPPPRAAARRASPAAPGRPAGAQRPGNAQRVVRPQRRRPFYLHVALHGCTCVRAFWKLKSLLPAGLPHRTRTSPARQFNHCDSFKHHSSSPFTFPSWAYSRGLPLPPPASSLTPAPGAPTSSMRPFKQESSPSSSTSCSSCSSPRSPMALWGGRRTSPETYRSWPPKHNSVWCAERQTCVRASSDTHAHPYDGRT